MNNQITYIGVDAHNFKGSLQIENGRCVNTSAILSYMLGWTEERVLKHLRRKRWNTRIIKPEEFA